MKKSLLFILLVEIKIFLVYNLNFTGTGSKQVKMNIEHFLEGSRCRWILIVILLISRHFSLPLISQDRVKFERISVAQGLSQSAVFAILQDKRGFIWLGTEDGLNRYDGYHFVEYKHDPDDPTSLSNNVVLAIYEDRSGALWIGTEMGLNRFNRETETFIRYKQSEIPHSLSNKNVLSIREDKEGVLWIGTIGGGLHRLDRERKQFKHYRKISGDSSSLSSDVVNTIYEDKSGVLWIGTGGGLNVFHKETGTFSCYRHEPGNPHSLSNDEVTAIFEDDTEILWVGTKDGFNRFDRQKGVFKHYKDNAKNSKSISHNFIYSIIEGDEDNTNVLWIGTYGGGLNRFDRHTQGFTHWQHRADNPDSISNNYIHFIYRDKGGILWIGTDSGLNKFDRKKEKFAHWNVEQDDSSFLINRQVWAIYKDREGLLWFGTDEGFTQLNRATGKHIHWSHDPNNPNSLSCDRVQEIYEDRAGMLWLGTHGGGLNRFDRQKKKFTRYKNDPSDTNSLSHNIVYAIFEDSAGELWIGTEEGLDRLDRKTGYFTHWINDPGNSSSLSNNVINTIYEDSSKTLWIGTEGGLNRFDRKNGTFRHWMKEPSDPGSISDNLVIQIYEDQSGTLWIGTAWGLNKFDRENDQFTRFNRKHGLPNERIYGILEDEHGRLWLSTNRGISRFDPSTEEFRNYDVHDGLQSNEFHGGSCYKSADGGMFFGGINGFNFFYPNKIEDNPHTPPIVITDFRILNEPAAIGEDSPLKQAISEADEIVLSYRHYVFSFEFAALDFTTPGKNRYKYKMEGFDKGWIRTDAGKRFVSYTNLSPGHYIFMVRGSNNDGIWNEEGVSIDIIIKPPFWLTWWFKIVLGVAFIWMLFFGYRYRTKRLRRKLDHQKRVQDILRKSRDLADFRRAEVEKLIAAISALLIAVDSNGEIFQWNETAEKCFGIKGTRTRGQLFVDVLRDYIPGDKLEEIMDRGLGEGHDTPIKNFEIPIDLKDKGTRLLLSAVNPILDRSGKKLGFLLLAEDITRRKEEERQRNLSQKLESLGQMAGNIAHEIKTPLQYIAHNGQFVCDSFRDLVKFFEMVNECLNEIENSDKKHVAEKIKQIIDEYDIREILKEIPKASDQIVSGVSKVSNIIQSMKEYSHPGRGVMEKADINKLLESTVVLVRNEKNKTLEIETELYKQLPQVACYPGELNQVFMNLLINAADAIQEKGEPGFIKITTAREGGEVIVSMSDNGCGIPDSIKDNVFNPFFTTKEVGKGTGQGLSTAYKIIIEKHKGKLYFKSSTGEGTTFYIHLPFQGES
jgi:PAS domain S-box-containing protein